MIHNISHLCRRTLVGLIVATPLVTSLAHADDLADFLAQGHVLFDARARYENVDQHGLVNEANADTIRERLGYETTSFWDLKTLVEIQATQHLSNTFNDTVNGQVSYPQVPDPEAFELNRLQLAYTGLPDITATVGRQVINLDDQRFIGASAFRQNEQTFDAAKLDYTGLPSFTATYAYIDRVNRVFGDRSPAGHFNGNIHLFNFGYDFSEIGKLTAYSNLLDIDQSPTLSTATYGLQFSGGTPLNDQFKLHYSTGYARQFAYVNNPRNFALNYWRLEGGIDYQSWSLTAGSETLGGNGTIGFSTPLATLHAFQGDADVFLTTPPQGIADRYGKIGYQADLDVLGAPRNLTIIAAYHDYSAVYGTGTLGHELNFDTTLKINEYLRLGVDYAAYDGTASFASRNKTWLSLTVNY